MASESSASKTIHLTDLVLANYRLWAAQTEATFAVHGVMDIVLGECLRPDNGNGLQASQATKCDRQQTHMSPSFRANESLSAPISK